MSEPSPPTNRPGVTARDEDPDRTAIRPAIDFSAQPSADDGRRTLAQRIMHDRLPKRGGKDSGQPAPPTAADVPAGQAGQSRPAVPAARARRQHDQGRPAANGQQTGASAAPASVQPRPSGQPGPPPVPAAPSGTQGQPGVPTAPQPASAGRPPSAGSAVSAQPGSGAGPTAGPAYPAPAHVGPRRSERGSSGGATAAASGAVTQRVAGKAAPPAGPTDSGPVRTLAPGSAGSTGTAATLTGTGVEAVPEPKSSHVAEARTEVLRPAKAGRAPVRRTRKARLRLSRVDPWSVMKTAFMFSIAAGIVLLVAVYALWTVVEQSGLLAAINSAVQDVVGTQGDTTPFTVEQYVNTPRVMGATLLISVVDVVLITALATLGSFLYNLAATVLGGLEVTLAED